MEVQNTGYEFAFFFFPEKYFSKSNHVLWKLYVQLHQVLLKIPPTISKLTFGIFCIIFLVLFKEQSLCLSVHCNSHPKSTHILPFGKLQQQDLQETGFCKIKTRKWNISVELLKQMHQCVLASETKPLLQGKHIGISEVRTTEHSLAAGSRCLATSPGVWMPSSLAHIKRSLLVCHT